MPLWLCVFLLAVFVCVLLIAFVTTCYFVHIFVCTCSTCASPPYGFTTYCSTRVCTFVAVFVVRSVQVIDGVHGVKLYLCQISVTDSVEARSGLSGGRSRHLLANINTLVQSCNKRSGSDSRRCVSFL